MPTPATAPRHMPGFTLVELLVVIAIIGILLGLLLPNLAAVQSTAKASVSSAQLQAFGKGFLDHATLDNDGRLSTGGFDHYRDGDITKVGWVADLVNAKFANPAKSLDPTSRGKISEEFGFASAALDGHGKLNRLRWANATRADGAVVDPDEEDDFCGTTYFGTAQTIWDDGYNTNYVATWHFVRGDNNITADDAYSVDASSDDADGDPEMCPLDGDGPLSAAHLADPNSLTSADKIALLGPAQVGNHDHDHGDDHGGGHGHHQDDVILDADKAAAINVFVDGSGRRRAAKIGDPLVEAMTDGPNAMIETGLTTPWGDGDETRMVHTLADVAPIHKAKPGLVNPNAEDGPLYRLVGGSAPMLFADGHVARVVDAGGFTGSRGDGWLGPFQGEPGAHEGDDGHDFVINASAMDEVRDQVWLGRLRTIIVAGGGSLE
jgi:prepilin-type N-terminal cleavage/methylation domain-containing protein/prepilin-type processing-associated H-X9-DG protein